MGQGKMKNVYYVMETPIHIHEKNVDTLALVRYLGELLQSEACNGNNGSSTVQTIIQIAKSYDYRCSLVLEPY